MKNRTIVFLIIFSFVVGFMLSETLLNIFERKIVPSKAKENTKAQITQLAERPALEIVKFEAPKKAMRGNYFEMFGYFRLKGAAYGKYALHVKLVSLENKTNLRVGAFELNIDDKFHKLLETRAYAIRVPVPIEASLGKYRVIVEVVAELADKEIMPAVVNNNFNAGSIELVSYNASS